MRRNAYWMKQEDDRILETVDNNGWGGPSILGEEPDIDISEGHIEERLLFFWYAGLVAPVWEGAYEIISEGRLYLQGQLGASHQPTATVDRVLRE